MINKLDIANGKESQWSIVLGDYKSVIVSVVEWYM